MVELTPDDWVILLNENYFFLIQGGHCIYRESVNDMGANYLERVSPDNFKNAFDIYSTTFFNDDHKKITVRMGTYWLKSRNRRTFQRIVFRKPDECPKDCYNLFKGYAFDPSENGSCELYKKHLRETICGGNEIHYDYLMRWMARAIQEPDKVGEVIIVIKGKKGAGKNSFVEFFGSLFNRSHYKQFQNRKYITGDFTHQLRGVIVLFSNEAIWAANKTDEGILKAMATDASRTDEAKGENAYETGNYLHVIMATNEEWAVPSSWDERRFFVLKIPNDRKLARDEYYAMKKQMESGGSGRLLWELQNMDIGSFNPMSFPLTDELTEQTKLSLSGHEGWWLECLEQGYIIPGIDWQEWVPFEALSSAYIMYCNKHNFRYGRKTGPALSRFIKDQLPSPPNESKRVVDLYYKEMGYLKSNLKRLLHWNLPAVEECRARFCAQTKQPIKWPPILTVVQNDLYYPDDDERVPF